MPIAKKISDAMTRSSWIRRMFEEGDRMRKDGKGPVYDFSLGNPTLEPPESFRRRLAHLVTSGEPGLHRYMANVGYAGTRKAVAGYIQREFGVAATEDHVVMTVGAGGGLNVILKAILDPGDEVIVLTPFFVEYGFYVDNHGGVTVKVPTNAGFELDHEAIGRAITPRTKALIVNTPNNPSGVVYSRESMERLADLLRRSGARHGAPIYLISDEPYRKIAYDSAHPTGALDVYENGLMVTSHSKDLGLAGERIGWIAVHPEAADAAPLIHAMAFANRTLGFVNAPALMQRGIEACLDESVDVGWYRAKRDRLHASLTRFGYSVVKPGGAFYFFPAAPGGDDIAFCQAMVKRRVLVVPGTGFGTPGHFRLAYCVEDQTIEGALPAFEAAIREIG
jgi:aspartate aminotransferase